MENESPTLYMGKYDSVEKLTDGFRELQTKHDALAQNKNSYTVPEQYVVAEQFKFVNDDAIKEASDIASKRSYTQSQFDSHLSDALASQDTSKAERESIKKEYGAEWEGISSYVTEDLGLSKATFNRLSKEELGKIKTMRESTFNPSAPSGGAAAPVSKVTEGDCRSAFKAIQEAKRGGSSSIVGRAIANYRNLSNRYAEQGA